MSIKKTIVISVLFHVVLFSAALLFSAGLFRGSGNSPDEKVFFVKLAVDNSNAASNEVVLKKNPPAPKKVPKVKQKKKHQVVTEKSPEIVKAEIALEKAPEPIEETVEDNGLHQKDPEAVRAGEEPVLDKALENSENQEETVHSSLLTSLSNSNSLRNGSVRSGLSPAMIDLIGNAIERAKSYPMLARRRGIEGTVHVSFRINESGKPDDIKIQKNSGHSILDSATLKVVQKAGPYPYVENRIEVPVAYRLRK